MKDTRALRRAPTLILHESDTPASREKSTPKADSPKPAQQKSFKRTPASTSHSLRDRHTPSVKKLKMVVIQTPDTPRGKTPKIVRKQTPARPERIQPETRQAGLKASASSQKSKKKSVLSPSRTSTPLTVPRKRILDTPPPYSEIRQTRRSRNAVTVAESALQTSMVMLQETESTLDIDTEMHSTTPKPAVTTHDDVDSVVEGKTVQKKGWSLWGWAWKW